MNLYNNIVNLLDKHNIDYTSYTHGPILSYEDAEKEKNIHKWSGVESKNVFMVSKSKKYYILSTIQGEKVDFKQMKELIGEKLSIASADEVKDIAYSTPGCVPPFGFGDNIQIIVDPKIYNHDRYLFSPGLVDMTFELNPNDLKKIFEEYNSTYI